ncbi:hypothetical protein GCM10023189_09690 [Nibrella saemangeumensis]|uniref:histidine kinase n=1 Tax=Nibrella saemangeumensis TaxID=1084526 RepID=A0ABP8MFN3_9BACT
MEWRQFQQQFYRVAPGRSTTALETVHAYVTLVKAYTQADSCYMLRERDEWTADVSYVHPVIPVPTSINPTQLAELTETTDFFMEPDFTPRRPIKTLLGPYVQVAGLRVVTDSLKGWILLAWRQTTEPGAADVEMALRMLGDKVTIFRLEVSRLNLEQQYEFLFATIPQAIIRINEDDNTAWVNQSAIELLDLEADNLRPMAAAVSAGMMRLRNQATNQTDINEAAGQLLMDSRFVTKEWIWTFADKVLSVLTKPIRTSYFKGRIWLFNDVSELYQLYSQLDEQRRLLVRQNEQLADAKSEIENLIGVIAHDLKSPLATISFVFDFLPMLGSLNAEQQDNINYGLKTVKRGATLIDSIVFYNKLISSTEPVHTMDMELNDLLEVVVDGFEAQARQKQIKLHLNAPDEAVMLHTDPESLVRILDNLISNALKFSLFGKNIFVNSYLKQGQLYIAVRDEGPGIGPDDMPRLFKRFQRLSAQPTNNESSSGLGLSIVKSLTEKLGATIEVESVVGEGTTFRLAFPSHFIRKNNPNDVFTPV